MPSERPGCWFAMRGRPTRVRIQLLVVVHRLLHGVHLHQRRLARVATLLAACGGGFAASAIRPADPTYADAVADRAAAGTCRDVADYAEPLTVEWRRRTAPTSRSGRSLVGNARRIQERDAAHALDARWILRRRDGVPYRGGVDRCWGPQQELANARVAAQRCAELLL